MHPLPSLRVNWRAVLTVVLSVALSMFILAAVVQSATTISTNISTGGTLDVTGATTLSSTLSVGTTTATNLIVSNVSTSTFAGGLTVETSGLVYDFSNNNVGVGTTTPNWKLSVVGIGSVDDYVRASYFSATSSLATSTFSGGATFVNTTVSGLASTSAIKVGDETAAPTINGLVHGYCTFTDVTLAASSTAGFTNCTSSVTGALVVGDLVFVQATSSFEGQYIITAASTTGVSTIQLRILNTGLGTADGTLSGTSVNFWVVR